MEKANMKSNQLKLPFRVIKLLAGETILRVETRTWAGELTAANGHPTLMKHGATGTITIQIKSK